MSEFLKPELPNKTKRATSVSTATQQRPVVDEATGPQPAQEERLVLRAKMPNTVGFWADAMLANAAFRSFNVSLLFVLFVSISISISRFSFT